MTLRRLIIGGVIAGLLAGLLAAIAFPRSNNNPPPVPSAAAQTVALGPVNVTRVAKTQLPSGDVRLRVHGTPQIEARATDPLDGPDWAVRVFGADRVVRPGQRRHGVNPVVGHNLCAQLGRLYNGRFGWLDADGTFQPAATSAGSRTWCGSRRPDLRGEPHFDVFSTITDPAQPAARVKSTIAWGVAGSAAQNVDLRLGKQPVNVPATPHNVILAVRGPELDQRDVHATVTYNTGRSPVQLPQHRWAPLSTKATLAARAPDPNGGLPYGLTVTHDPQKGWCVATGARVVGDRAGGINYRDDTFSQIAFSGGGSCSPTGPRETQIFRDHPVLMGWSNGNGGPPEEGGDTAAVGRTARRTQHGVMIFAGRAAPDVVAVTLETPRDVRTLIPTGPAHAIIAVYDGSFPTGTMKITARYQNGHEKTDTLSP